MDDTAPKLTINELLVWGLEWEQHLRAGPRGRKFDFGADWTMLEQYVIAANEALRQQLEQGRKKTSRKPKSGSTGGRPPGGIGEEVIRLIANGMGPEPALRLKAKERRKPLGNVRRAYKYALKKALQKTPR